MHSGLMPRQMQLMLDLAIATSSIIPLSSVASHRTRKSVHDERLGLRPLPQRYTGNQPKRPDRQPGAGTFSMPCAGPEAPGSS
jgi:hypothetical protein